MSKSDIKTNIEKILSDILSDRHGVKITIKFVKQRRTDTHGNLNTSGNIRKEQVLDKQT